MKKYSEYFEPVTFVLAHGAYHNADAWFKLRPLLEEMNHTTVAIDLPIDQIDSTLDTYAEHIARAAEGHKRVVIVGHSHMGRAISRVPRLLAVQHLIYLNAVVKPANNQYDVASKQPETIFATYAAGSFQVKDTPYFRYDKSKAMVFYSDYDPVDKEIEVTSEDIDRIVSQLRLQNRSDDAQALDRQPNTPSSYILSKADKVVRPEYSRYAAKNYLNVDPIEIPGGHSPFLLRPALLAKILDDIVRHA